ncbi:MAG: M14 family zinc carboxypeptidase, partial [Caldimonas sp.]
MPRPRVSSPAFARHARIGSLALALLVASACTTVSLEPGPSQRPVPVASPPSPPPRVEPPAPVAQTAPVASSALPAPVPLGEPPASAAAPPYGPAVAARFPDPPVAYRTPAFEPGHAALTSNAELHAALARLAGNHGQRSSAPEVRLLPLGTSQTGTPIEALLLMHAEPGASASPAGRFGVALAPGRPTVLLIGQQHGDEPAGSEALLVIAQELAQGSLESVLDRINVVVLPRANPDGAEANRRTTASGIDANRDHLLLKTP